MNKASGSTTVSNEKTLTENTSPLLSVSLRDMSTEPSLASVPLPHAPRLDVKVMGENPDDIIFGHLKKVMRERQQHTEVKDR